MTVAQLRRQMSSKEHGEWRMYYARRAQLEQLEIEKAKKRR